MYGLFTFFISLVIFCMIAVIGYPVTCGLLAGPDNSTLPKACKIFDYNPSQRPR